MKLDQLFVLAFSVVLLLGFLGKFMLNYYRRLTEKVTHLTNELNERNEQFNRLSILEQQLEEVERSRHEIVQSVRYMIQAGGVAIGSNDLFGKGDTLRGKQLENIGHTLPYLLSGRGHWYRGDPLPEDVQSTKEAREIANSLASRYSFSLPDEPFYALLSMLDLAMALFNPAFTGALRMWQSSRSVDT